MPDVLSNRRDGRRREQPAVHRPRPAPASQVAHWRRQPRVVLHGLTAVIAQAPDARATVRNISEGGMLVDGLRLDPGTAVDFTLDGEELHGTGAGHVVYRTDSAAGIVVRRWNTTLDDAIRHVIERGLLAASTWRELYVDPPVGPRPPFAYGSPLRRGDAHRGG